VSDDIADKRAVQRVLEQVLGQSATDQRRAAIRAAVANHSVLARESINWLGAYNFSGEKRQDLVDILPQKTILKSQAQTGEEKAA
jgi:hypothetical protein